MKQLLLTLTFLTGISAHAGPGVKYKSFAQLSGAQNYYITCAAKTGSDQIQVNAVFHYMWSGITPAGITAASISIVLPGEAMIAREYAQGLTFTQYVPTEIKISGVPFQSVPAHNDFVSLDIKDAPNGKFKGTLQFSDRTTGFNVVRDVTCVASNYTFPIPQ